MFIQWKFSGAGNFIQHLGPVEQIRVKFLAWGVQCLPASELNSQSYEYESVP